MSSLMSLMDELAKSFETVERLPLDVCTKMMALLDKAPEDALVLLVKKRVKFADDMARRRLKRRFGWSDERVAAL